MANEQKGTFDFVGKRGQSIFHMPVLDWVPKGGGEIGRRFRDYEVKYSRILDDRALAVVVALCLEESLDQLLQTWMPGYRRLSRRGDFTFSMKIDMALSLKLIPARILTSIHLIRDIRNAFAHNLQLTNFSQLVKLKKFKTLNRRIRNRVRQYGLEFLASTPRENFINLSSLVILALMTYRYNVKILNAYLRHRNSLMRIVNDEKMLKGLSKKELLELEKSYKFTTSPLDLPDTH